MFLDLTESVKRSYMDENLFIESCLELEEQWSELTEKAMKMEHYCYVQSNNGNRSEAMDIYSEGVAEWGQKVKEWFLQMWDKIRELIDNIDKWLFEHFSKAARLGNALKAISESSAYNTNGKVTVRLTNAASKLLSDSENSIKILNNVLGDIVTNYNTDVDDIKSLKDKYNEELKRIKSNRFLSQALTNNEEIKNESIDLLIEAKPQQFPKKDNRVEMKEKGAEMANQAKQARKTVINNLPASRQSPDYSSIRAKIGDAESKHSDNINRKKDEEERRNFEERRSRRLEEERKKKIEEENKKTDKNMVSVEMSLGEAKNLIKLMFALKNKRNDLKKAKNDANKCIKRAIKILDSKNPDEKKKIDNYKKLISLNNKFLSLAIKMIKNINNCAASGVKAYIKTVKMNKSDDGRYDGSNRKVEYDESTSILDMFK